MTAGRNFQQYGFLQLILTPHLLDAASMTPADRGVHLHALSTTPRPGERRRSAPCSGCQSFAQFRIVALGFSFGALFFVYALVAVYWSRRTAECALAFWVVNPLGIQHADYLHHSPLAFFFVPEACTSCRGISARTGSR